MDTTERFYKIDQTLRNRGVVSARDFLAVLQLHRPGRKSEKVSGKCG